MPEHNEHKWEQRREGKGTNWPFIPQQTSSEVGQTISIFPHYHRVRGGVGEWFRRSEEKGTRRRNNLRSENTGQEYREMYEHEKSLLHLLPSHLRLLRSRSH
ncbi:hypothetical protein PMAYCL1PPCAC_28862 [Pristionchus mayeri]|uniref:Uncharacterized protein n=1 Tax=Pristionchus mayeri TaxID=1317129 RepID=A0AAN5D9T7_9BILA|nr:hypothetical protein PMAYCL1PPCAC_28862 [Pristionchus mayeri]